MCMLGNYLARLFSDMTGDPSCKRYMCAIFGVSAVTFAALGYNAEIVAIFAVCAVGQNIASVFEKPLPN